MASPSQDASTLLASSSAAPVAHEGAARVFWRVLTRFDSSKLSPYLALRNSIGVLLPLVAGFALDMPRGGLVVASGALNVAYSDGSDSYAQRAKRMLSSSGLCALAVLFGALSGSHSVAAVTIATLWAFAAGMLVAAGTTAASSRSSSPGRAASHSSRASPLPGTCASSAAASAAPSASTSG